MWDEDTTIDVLGSHTIDIGSLVSPMDGHGLTVTNTDTVTIEDLIVSHADLIAVEFRFSIQIVFTGTVNDGSAVI